MQRKVREYHFSGVQLIWLVNPAKRIVTVYHSPDEFQILTENDVLDGGTVLPGFNLPVRQVFAGVPRTSPKVRTATPSRRTSRRGKRGNS